MFLIEFWTKNNIKYCKFIPSEQRWIKKNIRNIKQEIDTE